MCRHLCYLGPAVSLAELLLVPPHSLLRQSWAPADMRCDSVVNADGFGVGWYQAVGEQPIRLRSDRPLWTDRGFAGLARSVRSGAVLAAVRSATPGMPVVETACAPFTDGRWLFSLNGRIAGWPSSVVGPAGRLPVTDLLTMDAPTDSALLWAMLRHRLRVGENPADAVASVQREVLAAAPESRLNLLLTDGQILVATTWTHALSIRRTDRTVTVSSEPWDTDPAWRPVPDRSLLVANAATAHQPSTVDITGLDAHAPEPMRTGQS